MKGKIIIHDNGDVTIRHSKDGIWLSKYHIADLFGVMTPAITSNIRSILHQSILYEQEVCQCYTTSDGKQICLYNLDMITALSFRLRSEKADKFRRWIMARATMPVVVWDIPEYIDAILT